MKMLFKNLFIVAFADLALAHPKPKGKSSAQANPVADLRNKGLNRQPGPQSTFVCYD